MGNLFIISVLAVASFLSSAKASSIIEDLTAQHNAIILGNLLVDSADTEGRQLVTGNFTSSLDNVYTIGTSGAGHPQNSPQAGRDDLIVGGDFYYTGAVTGWNGLQVTEDAVIGGSADANYIHFAASGVASSGQGALTVNAGALKVDRSTGDVTTLSSGVPLADLQARFIQESFSLSQYGDSVGISVTQDALWQLGITASDLGYNTTHIINITQAQWENASFKDRSINVARAGDTVVINIAGTDINLSGGSMTLDGIGRDKVLINYYEAETLNLGVTHLGSVLAANATSVNMSKSIDGVAMLSGEVTKSNSAEFHNFLFTGDIEHLVPEPAGSTMLLVGYVMILMQRKRLV